MKIIYFDCFIGASGDMILSALLDLGVPLEIVQEAINKLGVGEIVLSVERVEKHHISALSLNISASPQKESLSYREMRGILERAEIGEKIKRESLAILERLAFAEASVHGVEVDEVHFHELGGVDTLVDIVGTVTLMDFLGIEAVYSSPLPLSYGFIEIEHGILPLPAPATMKLLEGVPVRSVDIEGETLTPTGAGIITHFAKDYRLPPMKIIKVGYGAGKKDFPLPNILRVFYGEMTKSFPKEEVVLLETNIDDMPPNLYEGVMNELFQEGALDVFLQPIIMKRSRPAVLLSVLCYPTDADKLVEIIFRETTTLGVRFNRIERAILERELIKVRTKWGEVDVKVAKSGDEIISFAPELRSCEEIARERKIPLKMVMDEAKRAFLENREDF